MPTLCAIVGLVAILAVLWALQRLLYQKMRISPSPGKHSANSNAGKSTD